MILRKQELLVDLGRYKYYKSQISKILDNRIKGSLVVYNKSDGSEFYHVLPSVNGKKKRIYIKENDIELKTRLATQSYLMKVDRLLDKRIFQLGLLLEDYEDFEIQKIFDDLPEARKKYVTPLMPSYEDKLSELVNREGSSKGFSAEDLLIVTNKGERVRSKSEKILADKFHDLGIEYRYELPLKLKDGTMLHPDFTFISPYSLKEIYWEHHGMMDNPKYALSAIRKIETFARNGIFQNERVILTFEASTHNLNYDIVDKLIYKYL